MRLGRQRGAETLFETDEGIKPGAIIVQDLRLKNVGTQTWTVSSVVLSLATVADPGDDCPLNALKFLPVPSESNDPKAQVGVQVLGKANDPLNDNTRTALFPIFLHRLVPDEEERNIRILPGDYEDVRLLLQLIGAGAEGCSGNQWQVSYDFTVLPTN